MKKYLSLICALVLSVSANAQLITPKVTPKLEFVMQLCVNISGVVAVGNTPHGHRQSIPITGGTFEGPNIKGTVIAGGADYQLSNGPRTEVEAIYNICTDDGVSIHVRNQGIITGGEGGFYFFTNPHFEAPNDSKYAWLNNAIFVCRIANEPYEGGVRLNVWKVCD